MTALSTPVDPTELHAQLSVLVLEEDKENCGRKSGDENVQAAGGVAKEIKSTERDVKGDTMVKSTNISMRAEEFYSVSGDVFCLLIFSGVSRPKNSVLLNMKDAIYSLFTITRLRFTTRYQPL